VRSEDPDTKLRRLSFENFSAVPDDFRPVPFWGINDRLRDDELRRQVGAMKNGGWSGFFVHPRYGMETPYLSNEYMDAMSVILDASREHGLDMWLYDEHPFPAGCAGGLVASDDRSLRHRVLALNVHNRLTPLAEGIAYFEIEPGGNSFSRIEDPYRYEGNGHWFAHFYEWEMPVAPTGSRVGDNGMIHGFPYADLLNPQAVQRFIDVTYGTYEGRLAKGFGEVIRGSFSDMPLYHWHNATPHPSIPWTGRLPEVFDDRYDYDLLGRLPELFFDTGEYAEVRHDYWHLVSDLFVDTFTAPVAAWCRSHNLLYVAHYWGEETLHWQVSWTGDVMHHFEHHDYVGCDHILRNIEDPIGIKQAATVAEQLGKPRCVAETYALSGYNLTFEERKWIGEWEYALGVNFLVPYIPSYSLRGRRKRDEPPSEFIQQPYWELEECLSAYFARLGYTLSCGQRVVDILVLQPLSSAWCQYRPGSKLPPAWHPNNEADDGAGAPLFELSAGFECLADDLLSNHLDFHLGNEHLLAQYARVVDGKFAVGNATYATVVVPQSISWQSKTVALLDKFADSGGRIITIAPRPRLVDGKPSDHVLPHSAISVDNVAAAIKVLCEQTTPDVTLVDAPSVLVQHRIAGDEEIFFFVNTSREITLPRRKVELSVREPSGTLERWDPLTGQRSEIVSSVNRHSVQATLDFVPTGSHLLVWRPESEEDDLELHVDEMSDVELGVALDGLWSLEALDPNAITLDYCEMKIGAGNWSARMPVWQAHELVHAAGIGSRFQLRFEAHVSDIPPRCYVAVEDEFRYEIVVNGQPTRRSRSGPSWWDPSLDLIDVTSVLRRGVNIIELEGRCQLDTEIENLYLVGEFGVDRATHEIVRPSDQVRGQNLVGEGYPFYAGRVALRQPFEWRLATGSAWFVCDSIDAVASRLRINDNDIGRLAWPPYRINVSDYLVEGTNWITLELFGSLHNLLGPHHDSRGEARHVVLDRSWMDLPHWTDDYFFNPFGVSGARICRVGTLG
jgi:hypothetical protein